MAAVTNYCMLGELKPQFITLQFCRLEIWLGPHWARTRCWQACIPSGASQEKSVPCHFLFVETTHISWLWLLTPSSRPKTVGGVLLMMPSLWFFAARVGICFLEHVGLDWSHLSNPGLFLHLKVLNLIISTKSFLPRKITYSLILKMRMGTS